MQPPNRVEIVASSVTVAVMPEALHAALHTDVQSFVAEVSEIRHSNSSVCLQNSLDTFVSAAWSFGCKCVFSQLAAPTLYVPFLIKLISNDDGRIQFITQLRARRKQQRVLPSKQKSQNCGCESLSLSLCYVSLKSNSPFKPVSWACVESWAHTYDEQQKLKADSH